MRSLSHQLLGTLQNLSDEEFKHFKLLLKRRLPRILAPQMDASNRVKTVKLIVKLYRQQSEELTSDILRKLNRMDLVQVLATSSPGLKGKREETKHNINIINNKTIHIINNKVLN